MKFNLTNETFLAETVREFPGASSLEFNDLILAVIFYNWIPVLVSFILYYPIVVLGRKLFKQQYFKQTLFIAFLLSITTPIIYIFGYKGDFNSMSYAEMISWTITFILSISIYFYFNKSKYNIPI